MMNKNLETLMMEAVAKREKEIETVKIMINQLKKKLRVLEVTPNASTIEASKCRHAIRTGENLLRTLRR